MLEKKGTVRKIAEERVSEQRKDNFSVPQNFAFLFSSKPHKGRVRKYFKNKPQRGKKKNK
jgi:hypothetical protein